MQFKKEFNSSGPNKPERHYTLERNSLMEKGKKLVYNDRYFTLFAPRQSGKSTFFRMLGEQLEKEGYNVCYTIFGGFAKANLQGFLSSLSDDIKKYWGETVNFTQLVDIKSFVEKQNNDKRILIVDEADGINPDFLNNFLHIIRDLYHSRDSHSLKSVILVGVQNITGVMQGAVSPFNINEELEVPYFTEAEILRKRDNFFLQK
jgi:predicted AAA+ superfamily ATPase